MSENEFDALNEIQSKIQALAVEAYTAPWGQFRATIDKQFEFVEDKTVLNELIELGEKGRRTQEKPTSDFFKNYLNLYIDTYHRAFNKALGTPVVATQELEDLFPKIEDIAVDVSQEGKNHEEQALRDMLPGLALKAYLSPSIDEFREKIHAQFDFVNDENKLQKLIDLGELGLRNNQSVNSIFYQNYEKTYIETYMKFFNEEVSFIPLEQDNSSFDEEIEDLSNLSEEEQIKRYTVLCNSYLAESKKNYPNDALASEKRQLVEQAQNELTNPNYHLPRQRLEHFYDRLHKGFSENFSLGQHRDPWFSKILRMLKQALGYDVTSKGEKFLQNVKLSEHQPTPKKEFNREKKTLANEAFRLAERAHYNQNNTNYKHLMEDYENKYIEAYFEALGKLQDYKYYKNSHNIDAESWQEVDSQTKMNSKMGFVRVNPSFGLHRIDSIDELNNLPAYPTDYNFILVKSDFESTTPELYFLNQFSSPPLITEVKSIVTYGASETLQPTGDPLINEITSMLNNKRSEVSSLSIAELSIIQMLSNFKPLEIQPKLFYVNGNVREEIKDITSDELNLLSKIKNNTILDERKLKQIKEITGFSSPEYDRKRLNKFIQPMIDTARKEAQMAYGELDMESAIYNSLHAVEKEKNIHIQHQFKERLSLRGEAEKPGLENLHSKRLGG